MKKIFLLIPILFGLSSCATIFGGKAQKIHLVPSSGSGGAEVEVVNGADIQNIRIPSMIIVPRSRSNLIIKVKESECYKSSDNIYESKLSLFFWLNVLGGLYSTTSTTTDTATGAMWSYDDNIMVNVKKKPDCKN